MFHILVWLMWLRKERLRERKKEIYKRQIYRISEFRSIRNYANVICNRIELDKSACVKMIRTNGYVSAGIMCYAIGHRRCILFVKIGLDIAIAVSHHTEHN